MLRLSTMMGSSSKSAGSCAYERPMASISGRTHAAPFSTGNTRRVGKRESRPWPMSDATVSKMPRPWVCAMFMKAVWPAKGRCSPPWLPSHWL